MIFQFVGYQNSGKTTMMSQVIECLTGRGHKVLSLKHHGHGGAPDTYEKDSTKHLRAGAIASAVEGDGVLNIEVSKQEWSIEKVESFLSFFDYDIFLVEGFKKADYPKFVFIRTEEDNDLLDLSNIKMSIPWCDTIEEKNNYIEIISNLIEGEMDV